MHINIYINFIYYIYKYFKNLYYYEMIMGFVWENDSYQVPQ